MFISKSELTPQQLFKSASNFLQMNGIGQSVIKICYVTSVVKHVVIKNSTFVIPYTQILFNF